MSSPSAFQWPGQSPWKTWQRIIFPFICIYFLLVTEPWALIGVIPGSNYILQYYFDFKSWLVNSSNEHLFHTYKKLIPRNGSGDTSYGWTEVKLNLLLAILVGTIWNLAGRKIPDHNKAAYWLKIILRYTIIINCFAYGLSKVFLTQMSFPSLSNLATPLGDLLPMRLSWLFIGYSDKYQFFLGLVECIGGVLLFFRRTATLGTLWAAGIFANVAIMNISYDIPVKIFSIHLLLMSVTLLAFESRRLTDIFIMNRPAAPGSLYNVHFPQNWMRIGIIVIKYAYVLYLIYDTVE